MAKKASTNKITANDMAAAVASINTPSVEVENAILVKELKEKLEGEFVPPTPNDPAWTEYLLDQLTDKEKDNGKPTNAGLRRLARIYAGHLVSQNVDVMYCPTVNDPYRATVKVTMSFLMHSGPNTTMSDAADISDLNTQQPFSLHPVGTATTVAESRCLKRLLCLNILTADESKLPTNDYIKSVQEVINATLPTGNPAQKHAISNLANKLGIDLTKCLNAQADLQNKELDKLSIEECSRILKLLGSFDRKEVDIPKDILK